MTAAKRRASSSNSSGSSNTSGSSNGNEQHSQQQHLQLQQQQQQHAQPNEYQQLLQHPHHHYQQHYNGNSNTSGSNSNSSNSSNTQQYHQRQQQHQATLRDCSVKLPLDILWLPKSAMRPAGPDTSPTDCILVVGVSRPKLAVVFLTVMLISLFLTFHVLYDSAVYNIQAAQAVHERHRLSMTASASALASSSSSSSSSGGSFSFSSSAGGASNHLPVFVKPVPSSNQLSHPMVFPSSRVHFPKTSRRLPQALIIGVRKCGTRALLEMLYLHPRIQKAGGEVHFFDRDENYLKGLEWYRKKMPHSFRGQITIEKSPSYFVSPEVPERVRAMNASIKLLLIVREPVTRAISDYTQLRSHAATAILPLAEKDPPSPKESSGGGAGGGGAGGGGGSGTAAAKMPTQSLLYAKLQSARGYDNALLGGSGAGAKETKGKTVSSSLVRRQALGSGGGVAGAAMTTTTMSPMASAAQMAAKSFEELAIFPNGTVNEAYRPLSISMYHVHLHRWLEVFPREQLLVVNGDRLIEDPVSQLKRIEAFLGIEHRVNSEHFYFNETKGFYCLRYDNGDRCLRETKGRKHPHVDPVVVSRLRKFFAEYNQRFYELVGEDLGWPEE
ncbi:centrosomal and chromosomal factor [Drosophila simulans]|uniref:centrosomal and chromosomal factor n=1 Tax=Drosophila simulans TaxID=7240 RepID=UPI00192D1B1E|nr:centrosomal and chromosomal factor [Drosophila simulans]XP_039148341.1 centrosomal and chromosomal factor [Drosophila simulans]XP_039148342.1 centrosomal and chromosomal factor [Drosophila simulans]XP_039148343.1 centrosomal and chromosomal factor [Drosophila simulans]